MHLFTIWCEAVLCVTCCSCKAAQEAEMLMELQAQSCSKTATCAQLYNASKAAGCAYPVLWMEAWVNDSIHVLQTTSRHNTTQPIIKRSCR